MEKRLRVLVVTLAYPPSSIGGYGILCAQTCEWLHSRGHELFVLTAMPLAVHSEEKRIVQPGPIPVRRTLRSYWSGSECLYPPLLEALALEQANQKVFRETVAEFQPDIVSFWHMGDMSLGLITTTAQLQLPMQFVIGDDWLSYGWWADGWIRRFRNHPEHAAEVERQTGIATHLPDLGALGTFCFVSDYTRRRAEQEGGWRFQRFEVVHPGVTAAEFPPFTPLPEHPWHWQLLWLGRVIEEKGIETAINAMRYLPEEAMLMVVGPVDAAYRQKLEVLATDVGIDNRLSFALAARQEARSYYQQADVTLFTSMIEHEAFGLVPLEAMASGCPVISTGIGGSAEYCIDEVNCLRVPPGDAQATAVAIRRLQADAALRQQLVQGGLAQARELTLDKYAGRIEAQLYSTNKLRRRLVCNFML